MKPLIDQNLNHLRLILQQFFLLHLKNHHFQSQLNSFNRNCSILKHFAPNLKIGKDKKNK
ncbi:hypothetical protein BpHYR1_037770 [Brachionus plicatilis]|uniref:Uncharacterized protein n=1 Tax=Brachionus plicatilis TaxID=10195 RepID=A0A3M7RA61_BRAPC|nr:hypothetical protein BpHYR1_037770 [Brachionus plicatilis]